MTSLAFEDIFIRFRLSVGDNFENLYGESLDDVLEMWLRMGIGDPYLQEIFNTLTCDDEENSVVFDLKHPVSDELDSEYVSNLLAKEMIVKWLEPMLRSRENVLQYYGAGESRFFSQANHISELRALLEDVRVEIKAAIADRGGLRNDYLLGQ